MQCRPDIKLIKNSRQVLKSKEVTVTELEVSNIFENLKEEECLAEQSEIKEENIHESMFFIGKLNIFKTKKEQKARTISSEIKIDEKQKKGNCLKYFQTSNQFEVLTENSEEDIAALIQRSEILKASRKSLKKCKTCNKKKRLCALDPTKCTAVNQICCYCGKVGHFPKSQGCKKRRRTHFCKQSKMKDESTRKCPPKVSRKISKLILKKIQELEMQKRRTNLFKLGEKCAKKFENIDYENNPQQFVEYCNKKIKKMMKISSVPNADEIMKIKMF